MLPLRRPPQGGLRPPDPLSSNAYCAYSFFSFPTGLLYGTCDQCGIINTNLRPSSVKNSYCPVSWLDVPAHCDVTEGGSHGVIALQAGVYSGVTLSTMRKFCSVSLFLQVTSPTSPTSLGRISRTSWAIIPRHKTLPQDGSGKDLSREKPSRPTSERNTTAAGHRASPCTGMLIPSQLLL